MADTWKDYSFSVGGEYGPNWPVLYGKVHSDLMAWMEAANAQTPDQLLELVAGPWESADPCGWTIKARLADTYPQSWPTESLRGQPVEVTRQWYFQSPNRFYTAIGPTVDWTAPVEGEAPYGTLSGLVYYTGSGQTYRNDLAVISMVAMSLQEGREFFAFFHWEYVSYRGITPLLITKDQVSGQWMFGYVPPSTSGEVLYGLSWNRRRGALVKSSGLSTRGSEPTATGSFRAPTRAMPSLVVTADPDAVWHYDRCLLPENLRMSSPGMGSWMVGPDGSGWLGIGGGLTARVQEPEAT